MSRIFSILERNTYRSDYPKPTEGEVHEVEAALGFELPEAYKEFVRLDGLNDLGFVNSVLEPKEVLAQSELVAGFVAFASNGCGDLFCWESPRASTSQVYLWSHETRSVEPQEPDFEAWLIANRREV